MAQPPGTMYAQTMAAEAPSASETTSSGSQSGVDDDNEMAQVAGGISLQRQKVYSARFEISTPDVEQALTRFVQAVQSGGGFLESRENSRVVCRVPAEHFDELAAMMPTLGNIVSQTIQSKDVTRQYQDMNLRIETAEWSRRRVLALLEKAEEIEDIITLEEELLKLTATIEGLKGTLRYLSEQIAYSKIEVFFRSITLEPKSGRPAGHSPFAWINRIGAEHVTQEFGPIETSEKQNVSAATLLPGGISVGPLDGFLVVKKSHDELKAITPDASKLWIREFKVPKRGSLDFWSKALQSNLIDQRGYRPLGKQAVRDDADNEGVEMIFDVVMQGAAHRYLIAIYVFDGPFWQPGRRVRVVEFAAPEETFDQHVAGVQQSTSSGRWAVSGG